MLMVGEKAHLHESRRPLLAWGAGEENNVTSSSCNHVTWSASGIVVVVAAAAIAAPIG